MPIQFNPCSPCCQPPAAPPLAPGCCQGTPPPIVHVSYTVTGNTSVCPCIAALDGLVTPVPYRGTDALGQVLYDQRFAGEEPIIGGSGSCSTAYQLWHTFRCRLDSTFGIYVWELFIDWYENSTGIWKATFYQKVTASPSSTCNPLLVNFNNIVLTNVADGNPNYNCGSFVNLSGVVTQ